MKDASPSELWSEYLLAERDRINAVTMPALDRFIDRLVQEPAETWHAWAKVLAASLSDHGADVPVRLPLFRRVLLPALAAGALRGEHGCARWLAFHPFLLAHANLNELPEHLRSAFGLLTEAVRVDPSDLVSRERLVELIAWELEYSLHELPEMVIGANHAAATEKECETLLALATAFRTHVTALSMEDRYMPLIQDCERHFRAYADYCRAGSPSSGYEQYLKLHGFE